MTQDAEPRATIRRGGGRSWGWAAGAFLLLYATFFVVHCTLDVAPPPWDEAYLLQYPVAVKTAWEHEGFLAAVRAFWGARFMKPPLSMMGTMVPLLLLGTDGVSYRLDNLVVAVASAFMLSRFLGRYILGPWATTFALGILVSPYALSFARIEMAELYLWAALIAFLVTLLPTDPFRTRGRSIAVGLAFGTGMLAKLSFPLLALGPSLWALVRSIRDGRCAGDLGLRVRNLVLAGVSAFLICAPFAAHNWKRMWHHLRDQYGWVGEEYRLGDPLSLEYCVAYFRAFTDWLGPIWLVLAVVLAALLVACRRGRRPAAGAARRLHATPWVPLVALLGVNLAYCYFVHPVPEPRFVVGSFLSFQLLVALGLGSVLASSAAGAPRTARLMLVPPLVMLLASSHLPSGEPVLPWNVPLLGAARDVVAPPSHAPDLRDAILARIPSCAVSCTIGIAGDHPHLNNDNLQLRILERGLPMTVRQIAYVAPDVAVPDRMRALGPIAAWIVIVPAADGRGTSWASRYARPVLDLLEAHPEQLPRVAWSGDLGDGTEVRIYARCG